MSAAGRYLIVGPAWVGDMVMAQSLFMTLRSREPGAAIEVVAPPWSGPLLRRMPEVNAAHVLDVPHGRLGLGPRRRLGRALRARGFTRAIVIPRSAKAALVPFFARVPVRTGYRGEFRYGLINDMRPLDRSVLAQAVQRQVALGLPPDAPLPPPIPFPRLTVDEANRSALVQRLGLALEAPVAAFMPGAEYGPAKQWPLDRYAELARRLRAAGFSVWVLGSARDAPAGEAVAAVPGVVNLCGRTRLEDAVDLLSLARVAVTNDSGLMHVAAAVGTPVAALYGSSTPDYTPPLSDRARVLYRRLPCSPCFRRECPLGHTQCLTGIAVDEVEAAALDLAQGVK